MKAVLHCRASAGLWELLARRIPDRVAIGINPENEADTCSFSAAMQYTCLLLQVSELVTAAEIQAAPGLQLIRKIGWGRYY